MTRNGLDVERLARAMEDVFPGWLEEAPGTTEAQAEMRSYAEQIDAAYRFLYDSAAAGMHNITDPNAPLGWQCGDPSCRSHGQFHEPEMSAAEWRAAKDHAWVSKSGRPYSPRVRSPACARCGATPDSPGHVRAAEYAAAELATALQLEGLLLAVEELDNSWTDEGDHIDWDADRLVDGLLALRREYSKDVERYRKENRRG